jgi:hypothetical protein
VPPNLRAVARYNAGWFVVEAKLLMPSLELRPLSVAAQENFHAANIGACRWGDRLIAMVRTVNWVIKDALSYEIRGGDTAWKSRLLLLELDRDLRVTSSAGVDPPEDLPQLKYHIDIGFADPRPFGWRGEVWFVSTFRQLNTQGLSEIVISRVSRARPNGYVMCDWHVVPSGMQPQHEKNWMPQVVGDELRLIDPTRVLTDSGAIVHNEPAAIAAENFRGGSQAVPFDEGWSAKSSQRGFRSGVLAPSTP